MIISRTPFRVSFCGGGTDLPDYYRKNGGAVISTAINKYMYVTVNQRFDNTVRLAYSKMEIVGTSDELQHELVRAALKMVGITGGIEITTMADIPAGTGLGSSSSLTVGVLNALYAYAGKHVSAEQLARQACEIEIDIVGEPIGKQDQYSAAYGGLQFIQFNRDDTVFVNPVVCQNGTKKNFEERLLFFYTGATRAASGILKEQKKNIADRAVILEQMKELASAFRDSILANRLEDLGTLLHKNWELKTQLANGISTPLVEESYQKARAAGATGGKLLGAGGQGFLLMYVEPSKQTAVREALKDLRETPFQFEPQGSKIIFVD